MGYTAYAEGTSQPITSNINFAGGQTIANTTIVAIPATGRIILTATITGTGSPTVDLLVDVQGWYETNPTTNSTGVTMYLHQDQIGSTRLTTLATDVADKGYTYAPYGTANPTPGGIGTPLQYTGQQQDPETGLYYLRNRYYDPTTTTFLTRDPIAPTTRSHYAYVGGDPLNNTDPTGLWCLTGTNKSGRCRGARAIEKYADDVANISGAVAGACSVVAGFGAVAFETGVGAAVAGVAGTCAGVAAGVSVVAGIAHTAVTCAGEFDEYCARSAGSTGVNIAFVVTEAGAARGGRAFFS